MGRKKATILCVKNKSSTNFSTKFYSLEQGATLGANRFDLLLEHISFDKLSNSDSKLIIFSKRRKDKVGQSYKKKPQNCMAWHYDPPKKCISSSFSLLYFRSSSY